MSQLDNTSIDPTRRAELVLAEGGLSMITESVCRVVEAKRAPMWWYPAFFVASWRM